MILAKLEKWFFYFLIFFLPWQTRIIFKSFGEPFSEWNSASFYLTDLLILAVIFLWLERVINKESDIKIGKAEIALFIFLAISALSLFKSQNFWLGVFREIKLIEMAVLFLYAKSNLFGNNAPHPPLNLRGGAPSLFQREGWGELNYIFKIFVVSGLFQAFIAIGQFIIQKSFGLSFLDESPLGIGLAGVAKIVVDGEKIIRPYGLMPHPNILAAFLLVAIFCALYLFTDKNRNLKWRSAIGYTAILAILTFAFFFTFSRTVIIVGLVAIFSWLIYVLFKRCQVPCEKVPDTFIKQKWHILNTLTIFFAICLLVVILLWPFLSARFDVDAGLTDQSLNLRVFYNKVALQFIGQNPIFGVGIGNFVPAFQASQALSEPWMYQPAHNIYLLIASEIGIFGLLAFLAFLFFAIKNAWRIICNLEKSHWLFAICALLFIGLFDHFLWTLQQGQLMLWVMSGILVGFAVNHRSSMDPALNLPS